MFQTVISAINSNYDVSKREFEQMNEKNTCTIRTFVVQWEMY